MPDRPAALVTGASAGIGREIAGCLAARGYDLLLSARRSEELTAVGWELTRAHGVACHVLPADLSDPSAPRKLFEDAAGTGRPLDVLVNNAGFGDLGPFAFADPAKLSRMIQVNVTALTELTRLVLPGMQASRRGRVLNVGSVAGFQPGPMMAAYYATKAYVNSLSEALSWEVRGTGVTVTCLCPGPTASEFQAAAGFGPSRSGVTGTPMTARAVADAGVRGMLRGKRVVIPGWRNKLLIFAERFVPRAWVIGAVGRMQQTRR